MRDYSYQELNGITDWFSDAYNTVTQSVSDAASWASGYVSGSYDWVAQKASELTATTKKQLEDFQAAVENLFDTQKEVDQAIESLPEGADKQRLLAKKMEARGTFEEYVLPAWQSFREWAGFNQNDDFGQNFGVVPFVGLAAVLGATTAAMYYINKSQELEMQILNDPALSKTYVATRGSLFSLGDAPKYIAFGLVGIAAVYFLSSSGVLSKIKK